MLRTIFTGSCVLDCKIPDFLLIILPSQFPLFSPLMYWCQAYGTEQKSHSDNADVTLVWCLSSASMFALLLKQGIGQIEILTWHVFKTQI